MPAGKIVNLQPNGYGFIRPEGADKDVFFHTSALPRKGMFEDLSVGDQVTFAIDDEGDRPRAVELQIVE